MRAPEDGGGRAGIVLNGSPLFNGAAESGPSKIRRWLLENDLVEAIVALPTNMFFNTGIATYIWILDNTKHPERKGQVQLIDGDVVLDEAAQEPRRQGPRDQRHRPRPRSYACTTTSSMRTPTTPRCCATTSSPTGRSPSSAHSSTRPGSLSRPEGQAQAGCQEARHRERPVHLRRLDRRRRRAGRGHQRVLRRRGEAARSRRLDRLGQAKIGYEIPFTRHFYKYVPPRPLAEIDADLEKQVAKILDLLREVEA